MQKKSNFKRLYKKLILGSLSAKEGEKLLNAMGNLESSESKDEFLKIDRELGVELRRKTIKRVHSADEVDEFFDEMLLEKEAEREIVPTSRYKPYRSAQKNAKWYMIAAGISLIVLSILFLWNSPKEKIMLTHETVAGQRSTVTLSDGTTIRMNAKSKLVYPQEFTKDKREVFLEGEAFFDVVPDPDKKFMIRSGGLITTVLGTSFNIYTKDTLTEVAVITGTVRVAPAKVGAEEPDKELTLVPNEVMSYNATDRSMRKDSTDVSHLIAWRDDKIQFDGQTVGEVAKILERLYGIKITVSDQRLINCIAYYGTHKNVTLKKILGTLEYTHKINYEFTQDGVVLSGGDHNCKDGYYTTEYLQKKEKSNQILD